MATFVGMRFKPASPLVWVVEPPICKLLNLHLEVVKASDDGFDWGQASAGAQQLAVALLRSVSGDADVARLLGCTFCHDVIARLPAHGWVIHAEEIEAWLIRRSAGDMSPHTLFRTPQEWGVNDGES